MKFWNWLFLMFYISTWIAIIFVFLETDWVDLETIEILYVVGVIGVFFKSSDKIGCAKFRTTF